MTAPENVLDDLEVALEQAVDSGSVSTSLANAGGCTWVMCAWVTCVHG